jgi:acyl-homoserine lactone acylase PvdQ
MKVDEMLEVGFFAYLDLNERASNSWVIGANLTDSGHALLCNDPHLDSALPG